MTLKINPSTVHLGKDQNADPQTPADNQYYADYIPPPPKEEQPQSCELPPALPIELTATPLIKIDQACLYTFPDVIPLPPVYNPPINIPCACETLTATNNVVINGGGEGSFLSIIAGGPQNCEGEQPANCNIALTGLINLPQACESFDVSVNVTSSNEAKTSSLQAVRRDQGCGVSIIGVIDALACANFEANSTLTLTGAAKGNVSVTGKGRPECGLDLTGNIDVQACESFEATSNFQVKGNAAKGTLTVTGASYPQCGVTIDGEILVDACEDFEASGNFNITGPAVKTSNFTITPKGAPKCGLTIEGDAVIEACTLFNVDGKIDASGMIVASNSIQLSANSAPECGLTISGGISFKDPCMSFEATGNFEVSGPLVKSNSLQLQSNGAPECGIQVTGAAILEGCTDFDVSGALNISIGESDSNSLVFQANSQPACGLQIDGEIILQACKEVAISVFKDGSTDGSTQFVDKAGTDLGGITYTPSLVIENDKCAPVLKYGLTSPLTETLNVCSDIDLQVEIRQQPKIIVQVMDKQGEGTIQLSGYWEEVGPCAKKLVIEAQDVNISVNLDFDQREITVCNGGSLDSFTVYGPSGGGGGGGTGECAGCADNPTPPGGGDIGGGGPDLYA